MTTPHTPAPWYAVNDTARLPNSKEIRSAYRNGAVIAEVFTDIPESDTNAKLISAAPELLAACQYVVKYHREHDSGDGELFGLDFVTTCIAAIAKAGKL